VMLDGDEHSTRSKLDEAHEWAATDTAWMLPARPRSFCTASLTSSCNGPACWLMLATQTWLSTLRSDMYAGAAGIPP